MDNKRVYVFRHGETEWSLSGRHTGRTDLPLTENGEANARRLRPIFTEIDIQCVLTSPLQRARQTYALTSCTTPAIIDDNLCEWDYGDYEGLTPHQIQAQRPGWLLFRDGCPNGESPDAIEQRVTKVIEKLHRIDGNVAIFAHGHVLRVLVARWLDLPAGEGKRFLLGTSTLSILGYYHGHPAIVTWNAPLMEYSRSV